jgi:hypothetical protein
MKLWETFDLTSLLLGLLIGAILAFLLRLQALKRLSLDIRKIGFNLGVEGFEETKPPGFHVGGNVGGDVAGRDMTKDQRRYLEDRSIDQSTTVLEALAEDRAIKILRSDHIRATTTDKAFAQHLDNLQRGGGDWFPKWIDACLARSDIREQIDARITEFERDGWIVRTLSLENVPGGLHVNIDIARAYASPARS